MALQQPLIVYPTLDETVDTTSTVTFYLKIRGTQCIKYTFYIYNIATNTLKYSDTVTLGATLYDGDTLNINVDMSSIGADNYYWYADLYYTSSDYVTTYYYTFVASSPPTCSFSPSIPSTVTIPSREFICAYSQVENVSVKSFTMTLYDGNYDGSTNPEDHIIATSGENTSSPNNIRYTFNGLISGQTYQIQTTGYTQGDVYFATTLESFDVSYVVPTSLAQPLATLNADTSITLDWGNVVSITGTVTGTTSYESDYLYAGNYGLNMAASAYAQFELDLYSPFTVHWVCTSPSGFIGTMGEVKDTAGISYIYFGYDGTRFYLNINGDYYYDEAETLTTNPYILGIIHDGITISTYHREVA